MLRIAWLKLDLPNTLPLSNKLMWLERVCKSWKWKIRRNGSRIGMKGNIINNSRQRGIWIKENRCRHLTFLKPLVAQNVERITEESVWRVRMYAIIANNRDIPLLIVHYRRRNELLFLVTKPQEESSPSVVRRLKGRKV